MSSYSPNPTAATQPAVTVRRSRRRIGILALLAIGTMINYLDRTVLGIAAPKLTAELGIDPAIMGNPLLRLRLDLCSGADPRRTVSRPLWQQSDLLFVTDPVVAVYPVPRHGGGAEDAAAVPLRAGH